MKRIADLDDIPNGGALRVEAGNHAIALFRAGDQVHALNAECPHRGGPLDEGHVEDGTVTCPWHAWAFNLSDGKGCGLMSASRVRTFNVFVEDGEIYLDID